MYTFNLFSSLVVRADILSSNEAKSDPTYIYPGGALNISFTGFAYTLPVLGRFCKFLCVQVRSLILPRIINPAHSYL